MSVIDDIKDRLRLEEEVGKVVKLERSGANLRGLCPFHTEKTPSFFVFPDSQKFKCFGCGESGDVLDFVQKHEGWDLAEAIKEMARVAGVDLAPLTPEQKRVMERLREKELIFAAACDFFHASLGKWLDNGAYNIDADSMGLSYARKRGWTDAVIHRARLGWFDHDWNGLRTALHTAGMDVKAPAAVALVGLQGDVAAWGKTYDIPVLDTWVKAGKIPAMPPEMLIYPHVLRGKVIYVSGRKIDPGEKEAKSWNPRRVLVGDKMPFFNYLWGQNKPEDERVKYCHAIVVEGQADAITWAQWGQPAVALAGATL